ncbi:acyl-CoA dehydrogenase family protein [Bacillus massilinigeriensis]|uniref:acyl-CoA dehydrogenase family protein n=1 Tax=Bacillus massilionigeriensis TaxID=1805475 RepID=UPI00096B31FF|nr:acyl-CoA dehydrogenase family protein [Bacillus massilionigeriensis]
MEKVQDSVSYTFQPFLEVRDKLSDFDNPFLLKVLEKTVGADWQEVEERLRPYVEKLSTKWRMATNEIARPENHPKLRHYDAYNNRIDRVVRPQEAIKLTEEVFGEGLFSSKQLPYEGIIKRYFLHGNGEAGITCPLACTDGLIALIEEFYDELPEEVRKIHTHTKEGINGDFALGAQFMSEIQGGSNIPANILRAVPDGAYYRLYGNKFFCSAVHADYSVVTARVDGTKDVAVFIVPSWLPGNKEKEIRNHFRINRLKWKLGTTELPSGEIDYDGAIAYRVGPQNRGVALAVSIVLTRSRLDIGFSSAAFVMRAAREAKLYAQFRHVFDRKIDEFPMAAAQIDDLEDAAKRMAATAFAIYKMFHEQDTLNELEGFALRELVLLQKIYASKEAVEKLRLAISIFGGHGAIEEFSSIPRLYRDSMVNELWEGPKNVLLAQIYRDLFKMQKQFSLNEILKTMFPHLAESEILGYSERIRKIMTQNLVAVPTKENKQAARNWELLWEELFLSYQYAVIKPYEELPILQKETFSN